MMYVTVDYSCSDPFCSVQSRDLGHSQIQSCCVAVTDIEPAATAAAAGGIGAAAADAPADNDAAATEL